MSIDFSNNELYEDAPLVTKTLTREDEAEYSLRPKTLKEYIGQEKAKGNLEVFIQAAKIPLDSLPKVFHELPPGIRINR